MHVTICKLCIYKFNLKCVTKLCINACRSLAWNDIRNSYVRDRRADVFVLLDVPRRHNLHRDPIGRHQPGLRAIDSRAAFAAAEVVNPAPSSYLHVQNGFSQLSPNNQGQIVWNTSEDIWCCILQYRWAMNEDTATTRGISLCRSRGSAACASWRKLEAGNTRIC